MAENTWIQGEIENESREAEKIQENEEYTAKKVEKTKKDADEGVAEARATYRVALEEQGRVAAAFGDNGK